MNGNGFKLWRRWDPRFGAMPLREAQAFPRWVIEVVPDLFEPGAEQQRDATLAAIGSIPDQIAGRFLVRTAHVPTALKVLRGLADTYGHGSDALEARNIPNRLVLAVYAETQAELDARVAELRAPRLRYEEVALTDMDAGIALAREEGVISSYEMPEVNAAKAKGPGALSAYLGSIYRYRRATGTCVDSGGLALYLSPREPLDLWMLNSRVERDRGIAYEHHPFDWVICAGMTGPIAGEHQCATWEERGLLSQVYSADRAGVTRESLLSTSKAPHARKALKALLDAGVIVRISGKASDPNATYRLAPRGPHPVHPNWIAEIGSQASAAEVPFCVPTLGEWAPYSDLYWDGDRLGGGSMDSSNVLGGGHAREIEVPCESVDYDPTWAWNTRGWDSDHLRAKPSSAYMQAVGSHLSGRAIAGRIFDEWPSRWERR